MYGGNENLPGETIDPELVLEIERDAANLPAANAPSVESDRSVLYLVGVLEIRRNLAGKFSQRLRGAA